MSGIHRLTLTISLIVAIVPVEAARAVTRRVPSQYSTIQSAIDASSVSDIVLVAPGSYAGPGNIDLDFHGLDLVCRSEDGPNSTSINAGAPGEHRAFQLAGGESRAAAIEGFTILYGHTAAGGGIACFGASPTIRNCIFRDCQAERGGGAYFQDSAARLERVSVLSCRAASGSRADGSALVAIDSAALEMEDCTISGNLAAEPRTGLAAIRILPGAVFRRCVITGNEGIGISAAIALLDHCVIAFNQAEEIESTGSVSLEGCIVRDTCDPIDLLLQPGSVLSAACTMFNPAKVAGSGSLELVTPAIEANPLFCDIPNCPSIPSVDGNFAVFPESPARPENNPCGEFLGAIEASSCDPAAVGFDLLAPPHEPLFQRVRAIPNPSPGRFSVAFRLKQPARVAIRLVSPSGRRVAMLDERDRAPGEQRWDGSIPAPHAPIAAGVYVIELEGGGERVSRSIVLVPK